MIGVLGLGSRSTCFYLEQLNAEYQTRQGGYSTCPLLLLNTDFNAINPFLPTVFSALEPVLLHHLNTAERLGITQLIIPNITLHECYDRLAERHTMIDVFHPVRLMIQQLQRDQQHTIVLFGSHYTAQSPALLQAFSDANIQVITPSKEDITAVDTIRQKIYHERESEEDRQGFQQLLRGYQQRAPVVLACTELSVITTVSDRVYDMARVQIESAIQAVLSDAHHMAP